MDKDTLFKALAGTLDSDARVRKSSEQTLHEFEKNQGFTAYLLDLIVEENVSLGIKISAAIFFKNRVTHYWIEPEDRPVTESHILINEKKDIKLKLIHTLAATCNSPQLKIQLTTALQKIFHADKWDDIISIIKLLIQDNSNGNTAHVYTGLLVLFEYTQSYRWSTLDGSNSNPVFEDITKELFPILEHLLQLLIENNDDNHQINDEMMYLIIKIFKYITYFLLPTIFLEDQSKLGLWCQYHILIINKPLPASVLQEDDISTRNQHPRIKTVKWCFGNLNRLLIRHGGGKVTDDLKSQFAINFMQSFVPEILNVYWTIIEKWSNKKVWISDSSLFHMILFLKELILTPVWPLIQEKLDALIRHVILPTLTASQESVELYEDDPEEYIRQYFNINRDTNTADIASICFVDALILKKFKESFDLLFNVVNEIMSARSEPNRNDLTSAMNVEGAFRILSTILFKLDRKYSPLCGKVDQLLHKFVYPELGEQTIRTTPFLTARACDTIAIFNHKYQDSQVLQEIFQAIVTCFQLQDQLPIQLTAVDALRTLVNEDLVAEHLAGQAPQLMETLLEMSKKLESDILTSVMEAFVEKFARNLEPYAKQLTSNISEQFLRIASEILEQTGGVSDFNNDNNVILEKESQAAGILGTISTLVVSMNAAPQVSSSLESILEPVIKFIFDNAMVSFIPEAVDILSGLVYSTETVSSTMWSLYQTCIDAFELYALEYFDVFQPFFESVINFGFVNPQLSIESPQVQALISVCFNVIKADDVEPIFAHSAFELLEMIILSLNSRFIPFLDRFFPEIFHVFQELESQNAFDGYMLHHLSILRIFFACLYIDPNTTLAFLQQSQFCPSFMQLWFKHSEDFQSVYGCKLQILALLSLLVDADLSTHLNQPDTIHELADLLISNLEVLPHAIKARQDILAKESSKRQESTEDEENYDEYNESYTGVDDFEADEAELEALKETPIDKIHIFEVFANKFNSLQQNPAKYEAIIGGLEESQLETAKKIIQINQQQQQQKQS